MEQVYGRRMHVLVFDSMIDCGGIFNLLKCIFGYSLCCLQHVRFDFFLIVGTNCGLLLLWISGVSYGTVINVIRMFRVGRVLRYKLPYPTLPNIYIFINVQCEQASCCILTVTLTLTLRLTRELETMAHIFHTLLLTLPSLANVGALLTLILYIYAVVGIQLFSKVQLHGEVDSNANFQTFWGAMLLLLRFSTGEDWNEFMHSMASRQDGCQDDPPYNAQQCGFNNKPGNVVSSNHSHFTRMLTDTMTKH